jgi:hypothetical protein
VKKFLGLAVCLFVAWLIVSVFALTGAYALVAYGVGVAAGLAV